MLLTYDSISLRGAGVVQLTQPKKGYRFSLDSLLLADFCRIKSHDRILEIGAGTGVISLLIAKKFPTAQIIAVEIEHLAFGLLCKNIEANGLSNQIVPVNHDLKHLNRVIAPNSLDVIVANPPYTRHGSGKASPSLERQTARQDQTAPIGTWLIRQDLLKNKGKYFFVFSANRIAELMSVLREHKLEPKSMRFVHPHEDKKASFVLVETVKYARIGLEVAAPLIIHDAGGGYTSEMRGIYGLEES